MRRRRIPSYLSPSKLLSPEEYEKYKSTRQGIERINLAERMKELQKEKKYRESLARYEGTSTGKLGRGIASGIRMVGTRGGIAQGLYRREGQLPPQGIRGMKQTIQGSKSGRLGRPKGTLDKRYAQFGGVYGYRKYQANQLKIQRMEAFRRQTVTPEEQQIITQIHNKKKLMGLSVEAGIIPDTAGYVDLDSVFKDIDDASNLVD